MQDEDGKVDCVVTDNLSESWRLTPDLRSLKSEWD